ncbi:hypothetical protein [Butyrivibrio sp. INlla21]|uniref:hypothetical protein n=1 Tax=Butyrivibrio sp. INlla21 TaxID=1520811 RepID=UPI0008EEFE43|nr:hypothetical protein [Butyrivibrio sp. INlla21]SFU59736.1 hypothetical protein SAMN02910342_01072 [Butyrivibrio sp. INlla21]
MSIHSRIEELKRRIKKYRKYIRELEELYRQTEGGFKKIERNVQIPEEAYDLSRADKWRGILKDEGKRLKDMTISNIKKDQALTSDFMSDILVTIENLHKLIQDCEEEIEELEAMLYAPAEQQM